MTRFITGLVLASALVAHAQTRPDPTGHWEGTITIPVAPEAAGASGLSIAVEVDLSTNAGGAAVGTISVPAEGTRGLPLKVTVDGSSLAFHARADQTITGELAPDGASMAAKFHIQGYAIPFTLVRTGAPRIEPAARIAAVPSQFEGAWSGTLQAGPGSMRLALLFANRPDGTAAATIVNHDQGGLEIPASAVTPTSSSLTIEFKAVGAVYTATANADGTELAGTFSGPAGSAPLVFRRAPADPRN